MAVDEMCDWHVSALDNFSRNNPFNGVSNAAIRALARTSVYWTIVSIDADMCSGEGLAGRSQ